MASARPLFVVLLVISSFATSAFAAGDGSDAKTSGASVQTQTAGSAWFGQSAPFTSSDLFFMKDRPRLNFATPAGQRRSAVLNGTDCYTMRMYKVKRKEHFAAGENGLRGYSTCELASNYQVRTAIAHPQTIDGNDSLGDAPVK